MEHRANLRSSEIYNFSEYVCSNKIIPSANSPIVGIPLTDIIKASGVSMGAYAGFLVGGETSMLFLSVPIGMILFGAAAGVATALENGLRQRLQKLLVDDFEVGVFQGDTGKEQNSIAGEEKEDVRKPTPLSDMRK